MREQHLGDDEAVAREQLIIDRHEPRLSDGGAGLFFRENGGPDFKTQGAHAGTDRTTGDEHDLLAGLAQHGNLPDELFELRGVGLLAAVGEDAGAEFHDDAAGGPKGDAIHGWNIRKFSPRRKYKYGASRRQGHGGDTDGGGKFLCRPAVSVELPVDFARAIQHDSPQVMRDGAILAPEI